MKQIFLLAVSAMLFFSACKKATDVTSREDQLRGEGGWQQTAGMKKYRVPGTNIDSNTDYWRGVAPCFKDNRFVFGEVNNGTLQSGANRCDIGEPSTRNFFWQLLEGDEMLEINYIGDAFFGAEPVRAQISDFSSTSMKLTYTITDTLDGYSVPSAITYTNTYTK